jgi:hypothetical protein
MTRRGGAAGLWLAGVVLAAGAACVKRDAAVDPVPAAVALPPGEVQRIEAATELLVDFLVEAKDRRALRLRSRLRSLETARATLARYRGRNTTPRTLERLEASVRKAEAAVATAHAELRQALLKEAATAAAREDSGDARLEAWARAHERCTPIEDKLAKLRTRGERLARTEQSLRDKAARIAWNESNRLYDVADQRFRAILEIRRKYSPALYSASRQYLTAKQRLRRTPPSQPDRRRSYEATLKRITDEVYMPAREKFRTEEPAKWALMRDAEDAEPEPLVTAEQEARAKRAKEELAAAAGGVAGAAAARRARLLVADGAHREDGAVHLAQDLLRHRAVDPPPGTGAAVGGDRQQAGPLRLADLQHRRGGLTGHQPLSHAAAVVGDLRLHGGHPLGRLGPRFGARRFVRALDHVGEDDLRVEAIGDLPHQREDGCRPVGTIHRHDDPLDPGAALVIGAGFVLGDGVHEEHRHAGVAQHPLRDAAAGPAGDAAAAVRGHGDQLRLALLGRLENPLRRVVAGLEDGRGGDVVGRERLLHLGEVGVAGPSGLHAGFRDMHEERLAAVGADQRPDAAEDGLGKFGAVECNQYGSFGHGKSSTDG